MGTQVLYPQDYFITPTPAPFSHRSNRYGYNNRAVTSRYHRKPATRPGLKKPVAVSSYQPEASAVLKRSSVDDSVTGKRSGLAVEKVTILRRGKSLDSVKIDTYAGSAAFGLSPSPSALPLPSFLLKKQLPVTVDDSATRDLRRLLRLNWWVRVKPEKITICWPTSTCIGYRNYASGFKFWPIVNFLNERVDLKLRVIGYKPCVSSILCSFAKVNVKLGL